MLGTAGHPPWSYPGAPDHGPAGSRLGADHHVQHHAQLTPMFRFSRTAEGGRRLITFGHGARHLVGTGLAQRVVESAIGTEIEDIARQASRTGTFWARVKVGGKSIEYRAHTLPNGDIHIGTYYPV